MQSIVPVVRSVKSPLMLFRLERPFGRRAINHIRLAKGNGGSTLRYHQ